MLKDIELGRKINRDAEENTSTCFVESTLIFYKKYIDMLKAGGTMRHQELLIPFKLDASDPTFWKKGLLLIEDLITELADD